MPTSTNARDSYRMGLLVTFPPARWQQLDQRIKTHYCLLLDRRGGRLALMGADKGHRNSALLISVWPVGWG